MIIVTMVQYRLLIGQFPNEQVIIIHKSKITANNNIMSLPTGRYNMIKEIKREQ